MFLWFGALLRFGVLDLLFFLVVGCFWSVGGGFVFVGGVSFGVVWGVGGLDCFVFVVGGVRVFLLGFLGWGVFGCVWCDGFVVCVLGW